GLAFPTLSDSFVSDSRSAGRFPVPRFRVSLSGDCDFIRSISAELIGFQIRIHRLALREFDFRERDKQ
ncbi:hypothetical protein, partial [Streptomyces sp. NPDC088348]|uniref:hypothetical protein n=1 Tax=Streptomyces sp. NPDC088348 TaxID=3365853 RepID=UPI00382F9E91